MGFNYARSKATAKRLITKFGQQGKLLVMYRNQIGNASYTEVPVAIAILNYDTNQIDGTRITSKDRLIYVEAAQDITPNDRIQDAAGVKYEIIPPVKVLNPAGTAVYYEVQGRA